MKSLMAFLKKEFMEQSRTSKLVLLGILFTLFGIMSPVIAKLTPLMVEMMAETMAQSGIIMTEVTVTALDCWAQFYKNVPLLSSPSCWWRVASSPGNLSPAPCCCL